MTDENLGARLRALAGAVVLARRAINASGFSDLPGGEQDRLWQVAARAEAALQNFVSDLVADDPRSQP